MTAAGRLYGRFELSPASGEATAAGAASLGSPAGVAFDGPRVTGAIDVPDLPCSRGRPARACVEQSVADFRVTGRHAGFRVQSAGALLTGTVSGPDGAPVEGAPIQAKNAETGATVRTFSAPDGRYTFTGLAAGGYELSIVMPCCAFRPYASDQITLRESQAHQLDVQLEEGESLNTLGDDPGTNAAALRRRAVVPEREVPRTADARPDLSGVWLVTEDPFPEPASALPWAEALAKERIVDEFRDHPHVRCLPGSPPFSSGASPFMGKFVHTPSIRRRV